MATLARRDDAELARAVQNWCRHMWPEAAREVAEVVRPTAGWTNETLLVRCEDGARFVVRLPPPLPTWQNYDLAVEASVLQALRERSLPVPGVLAFDTDPRWFGAPFVVLSFEAGRPIGEVAALDPWLVDAGDDAQRAVHVAFVQLLAALHSVDWRPLTETLRGAGTTLAAEIAHWREYIEWASDGAPAHVLADAAAWCARTVPESEAASSLCWGDARLGNVLYHEDFTIASVLDWETASIGPAEMDLAWYLALDDLTVHFTRRTLPGFLTRAELIATYEEALGRTVVDLAWHEIFALVRSTAINDRQARLATQTGASYPGIAGDDNPVLPYLTAKIDAFNDGA
jgi:aminoglycoside phosphotransferase (APT) family kinase protein